uniref:STAS domain-containing protein n=1 Tax=Panagrolaimus sp. ES5 TaxID=591445 RepID=A0AC34FG39_9BILA
MCDSNSPSSRRGSCFQPPNISSPQPRGSIFQARRASCFQFDDNFISNNSGSTAKAVKNYLKPCTSPMNFLLSVKSFFPIITWLSTYEKSWFISDMIAGIVIAILHVPQGISYAFLSQVHPVNGLYASFFAPLFYMFFATSKHMSVGSFAVIALMTGAASDDIMKKHYGTDFDNPLYADTKHSEINRVSVVAALTFTLGICQLLVGALRLNFIFSYFSDPLVGGFSTGAAIHVIISQFDGVLDINSGHENGPGYLFGILIHHGSNITKANIYTVVLSLIIMIILIIGKEIISPFIGLATYLSFQFNWTDKYKMPIVGEVPRGFPAPSFPVFQLILDSFQPAIAITVVTITLQISFTKMFAKQQGYKIDPGQEVYALGFTSFFSGFFPTYPTSPGISRTSVGIENGGQTQLAAVSTCAFLLAVILLIGPYFEYLPKCVLAAVILVAMRSTFGKFREIPKLWYLSKTDCFVWISSFITTVFINVTYGLILSFCAVLVSVVLRTQWPTWNARFSRPQATITGFSNSGVIARYCVFRYDAILIFTNFERFKTAVHRTLDEFLSRPFLSTEEETYTKAKFIFDCSAITEVDSMGILALKEMTEEIEKKANATVAFANANCKLC